MSADPGRAEGTAVSPGPVPPPEPPRGRFSPRQRRIARGVLAVLGLLVLVVVIGFWQYSRVRESTDDAQIEGDIVPIAARVGGTVKSVPVRDNQVVQAGDVLAVIEPIDYEVALRRYEAELADAEAQAAAARTGVPITTSTTGSQLNSAQAQLVAAQRDVEAAHARLAEAEANAKKTAADLARYKQLVEKDEISRQQYDAAIAADTAARAAVSAAQAGIAVSESRVAQAQAGVASARTGPEQVQVSQAKAGAADAALRKAAANLEQAKLNLAYTTVKAPAMGIVSRKTLQPGQVIQPGQPLMSLVSLERMWVVANYKENQLRNMRAGQPVSVHVDAYGRAYAGRVESIGGATASKFSLLPPENATGNFVKVVQRVPVKIVFDEGQDREHLLRPGLSVVPTVRTD